MLIQQIFVLGVILVVSGIVISAITPVSCVTITPEQRIGTGFTLMGLIFVVMSCFAKLTQKLGEKGVRA